MHYLFEIIMDSNALENVACNLFSRNVVLTYFSRYDTCYILINRSAEFLKIAKKYFSSNKREVNCQKIHSENAWLFKHSQQFLFYYIQKGNLLKMAVL